MNIAIMVGLGVLVGIGASFSGLGGGFIMVPLLIYLGFTAQRAVGTSFLAILVISLSALFAHGKLNHVDYRMGIFLGLGGILGAQIGSRLVEYVSNEAFNKIFAIILIALAVRMFFQK
ncbi:MAG TPA: sulfite exporter TauE/SafE family protein [Bacillota bacterium]|nr:sulfite exporter TauE/SafE family protein [Peptococcaceae bacterium MAG4]NLW38513.1 sulfite exporter TauE/SafE family protein [Peptococcaceae bacterium]HPZ43265.1 sulfite exporter TauE/SafE family protein [Bacillota bacterium]HQD75852.1 sulfite exporter TauE/SafE family protein [Bacillota bacterium]HUM57787.1 sulfite exporter TauE/SafE family protein [Bacillota bacterium]